MLKHGILGLINYHEMTGYEIMQTFKDSLNFFWKAQTSQIYRELQVLEKKDEKGKTILETWAPFKTIKTRPQSDQAVIQTDDPSITIPKAAICKDGAQEGFDLMAIGFPLGEVKTRTYGEFISLDYLDKKLQDSSISDPFYRTTVPIIGGNSGGGLFMEEDGSFCLTGLATAVMPVHYPMSWFSNLDGIKELLKDG